MNEVMIFASILSPVVLGFIELIKRTWSVPKNLVPLMSLAAGILIGFLAQPLTDLDIALRLWAGGFAGLSATGLFEIGNRRTGTTYRKKKDK